MTRFRRLGLAAPLLAAGAMIGFAAAPSLGFREQDWWPPAAQWIMIGAVLIGALASLMTVRHRWGPRKAGDLFRPGWYYYTVETRWIVVGGVGLLLLALSQGLYVALAGIALATIPVTQMRPRDPKQ